MSKGPLSTGCTPRLHLLPCSWWPETPAMGKRQASITIRGCTYSTITSEPNLNSRGKHKELARQPRSQSAMEHSLLFPLTGDSGGQQIFTGISVCPERQYGRMAPQNHRFLTSAVLVGWLSGGRALIGSVSPFPCCKGSRPMAHY